MGGREARRRRGRERGENRTPKRPDTDPRLPTAPPALAANDALFASADPAAVEAVRALLSCEQAHLFESFPPPGEEDADKLALVAQLSALHAQYPGGLAKYVSNARALLGASAAGENPFEGLSPSVPEGERIDPSDEAAFDALEAEGLAEAGGAAFVLVAGGLGERLGYHGIKVALPAETATARPFLEVYCRHILALQARVRRAPGGDEGAVLPLAIMTSGDTHDATARLLEENARFGMAEGQVTLVRQEKVACLADSAGRLAVNPDNRFEVLTKPHGHGDVHTLLHQSGLAGRWAAEGRRWLLFFQDTNVLVFRAFLAALGVSKRRGFEVNSLTVARRPGEAVGAICRLEDAARGTGMTLNVEYNQLDPLLRATVSADGDVADPDTGFSPYPGNCNVLLMSLPEYASTLERTGGAVPEFVNPKYADATKTAFKKPTRLECMMQDYPRLLGAGARVGFTQCERWMSFSAAKNSLEAAAAKQRATGFAEGAAAAEADAYEFFRRALRPLDGVEVEEADPAEAVYGGVPTRVGAKIVVSPDTAVSRAELAAVFGGGGGSVRVTARSSLVVDGPGVRVRGLDLDGALVVRAVPGARVTLESVRVRNAGWEFVPVDPADEREDEVNRIRGYRIQRNAHREIVFDQPGDYVVRDGDGDDRVCDTGCLVA